MLSLKTVLRLRTNPLRECMRWRCLRRYKPMTEWSGSFGSTACAKPLAWTTCRPFSQRIRPPPALMLPKVRTPDEVVWLDGHLTERGHACRLHVIIETNEGLEAASDIAKCSSRIDALFFGGVDMAAELRCKNAWEPLLYARSRVVHAAASSELDVIDVPFLDLEDLEGKKREAALVRELGFCGKGSVHPKQIPALNEVFTPDRSTVERAKRVIREFEAADTGLVVIDGKLIEKPVLREMQRILAVSDRVAARN